MEQVMCDSDHEAILQSDERMDGLLASKESLPCGLGNLFVKRARPMSAVETVVSIPERPPTRVISSLNRPHEDCFRHGYELSAGHPSVSKRSAPFNRAGRPPQHQPTRAISGIS